MFRFGITAVFVIVFIVFSGVRISTVRSLPRENCISDWRVKWSEEKTLPNVSCAQSTKRSQVENTTKIQACFTMTDLPPSAVLRFKMTSELGLTVYVRDTHNPSCQQLSHPVIEEFSTLQHVRWMSVVSPTSISSTLGDDSPSSHKSARLDLVPFRLLWQPLI